MHARQFVSIASTLAGASHILNRPEIQTCGDAAHSYWLANRFRCDAWHARISQHRTAIDQCGTSRRTRLWHDILPTLQEILCSEPLTRTIAYLAAILETHSADGDWSPLAQSVLSSHVEARLRCLNLMVFGYGIPVEQAVRLNRLRRLMEFASDALISSLPPLRAIELYAFDVPLVLNQQKQFRSYPISEPIERVRVQILISGVEQALLMDHDQRTANPQLNENIAEAALGLLPKESFDSFGVSHTRTHTTASHSLSDIEVVTDDLDHPLAAPFDLFVQPKRQPTEKTRRRL